MIEFGGEIEERAEVTLEGVEFDDDQPALA
jgi:hypothetical protein